METVSPSLSPVSAWSRLVAMVVAGLLLSGALLRIGALSPTNVLGADIHERLFTAHGVLVLPTMFLALVYFAPRRAESDSLRVPLVGAQIVSATLVMGATESRSMLLAACGIGLVSTLVFAVRVLDPRSWAGVLFGVATLAQFAAYAGAVLGVPQLVGISFFPTVLAAFVARSVPSGFGRPSALLWASCVYAVARAIVRSTGLGPVAIVELVAGLVLSVLVFRAVREESDGWRRWVRRIECVLFAQAVLLGSFLGFLSSDVHLHDTLFAVAAFHLEAFVLVFAFVRALDRSPRSALFLAALGAHVFCWAMVIVGSRGMPRRYAEYLPEFTFLQVTATLGALVACASLFALVLFAAKRD